jgi:MFS family permease
MHAHFGAARLRRAVRSTFASLKHRNYRLFFIGQGISNTGNWLTNIALVLLVLKITGSGLDVGLLAACQYGPILLLAAKAGAISDRLDRRKMLLVTQSLEMLESAGLAVLAFLPHPPLAGLFLMAAAGGTILAFDNPLRRSFVSEMVPKKDISNAVVIYSTLVNTSRILGPALAGALVVTAGFGWAFSIDAASYVVVLVCIIMMRPAELYRPKERPAKDRGEVRAGIRYALSEPLIWISLVMLALIGTLSYNFNVSLPIFVSDSLHRSNSVYTILYSIFGSGSVISALFVAHKNLVNSRFVVLGAAGFGLMMLLLGFAPGLATASVAVFLLGLATLVYTTATTALIQVTSKANMVGRVLALQSVLLVGPKAVGGPLLGWLADYFGGRAPILLGAIVCLLAAAFGYFAFQRTAAKTSKNPPDPIAVEQEE